MPTPRDDRPGQPVYVLDEPPEAGETGLRRGDARRSRRARACVRRSASGGDRDRPARARSGRLSLAHAHADRGRPLVALARGRADPLQGRGVGVDAERRAAAAGLGRPAVRGTAATRSARMRDLCRLLLERVPTVCLFVRPENAVAIHVYEAIGMQRTITYRSLDLLMLVDRIEAFIRAHDLIEPRRRGDVPRLRRRRLDVSLARARRARLSRLGAARESQAARRRVGRGRALLRRRARRRRVELDGAGLSEAELREQRYSLARERLRATGHTASDQVETILYRLVSRGSATGIAPSRPDGVVHPLLDVWRGETKAYCEAEGLRFRVDSSNADTKRGAHPRRDPAAPAPAASSTRTRTSSSRSTRARRCRRRSRELLASAGGLAARRPGRRRDGRARVRPALARAGADRPERRGALGRLA